jgi:hypothetical protein
MEQKKQAQPEKKKLQLKLTVVVQEKKIAPAASQV